MNDRQESVWPQLRERISLRYGGAMNLAPTPDGSGPCALGRASIPING
jgi:hypothetical protein